MQELALILADEKIRPRSAPRNRKTCSVHDRHLDKDGPIVSWSDALGAEIEALFAPLAVPTFAGFRTFERQAKETAAERRERERLERIHEKRLAYHRTEKRRAYYRKRWRDLKDAPLVATVVDGVVWMLPPPELEKRRRRAREYEREKRTP